MKTNKINVVLSLNKTVRAVNSPMGFTSCESRINDTNYATRANPKKTSRLVNDWTSGAFGYTDYSPVEEIDYSSAHNGGNF